MSGRTTQLAMIYAWRTEERLRIEVFANMALEGISWTADVLGKTVSDLRQSSVNTVGQRALLSPTRWTSIGRVAYGAQAFLSTKCESRVEVSKSFLLFTSDLFVYPGPLDQGARTSKRFFRHPRSSLDLKALLWTYWPTIGQMAIDERLLNRIYSSIGSLDHYFWWLLMKIILLHC